MDIAASGKKVLLVEDDNNLASVYSTRLEAEGYSVRRVADGEHALTEAMAYQPDLILLDLMMPALGGFDVLDILRNTPETASTKIIVLTARGQEADKARAQKLGADAFLVKSQVVIADVMGMVKKLMSGDDGPKLKSKSPTENPIEPNSTQP